MTREFQSIYNEAQEAGLEAVKRCTPTPMVVQSVDAYGRPTEGSQPEVIDDGVCGFAWVNVKPATTKFARWMKAEGLARADSYYGGLLIWVSEFNQSMEKKETYARAFAQVLTNHGYTAYPMSRMD